MVVVPLLQLGVRFGSGGRGSVRLRLAALRRALVGGDALDGAADDVHAAHGVAMPELRRVLAGPAQAVGGDLRVLPQVLVDERLEGRLLVLTQLERRVRVDVLGVGWNEKFFFSFLKSCI